jgi:hypothetical protein
MDNLASFSKRKYLKKAPKQKAVKEKKTIEYNYNEEQKLYAGNNLNINDYLSGKENNEANLIKDFFVKSNFSDSIENKNNSLDTILYTLREYDRRPGYHTCAKCWKAKYNQIMYGEIILVDSVSDLLVFKPLGSEKYKTMWFTDHTRTFKRERWDRIRIPYKILDTFYIPMVNNGIDTAWFTAPRVVTSFKLRNNNVLKSGIYKKYYEDKDSLLHTYDLLKLYDYKDKLDKRKFKDFVYDFPNFYNDFEASFEQFSLSNEINWDDKKIKRKVKKDQRWAEYSRSNLGCNYVTRVPFDFLRWYPFRPWKVNPKRCTNKTVIERKDVYPHAFCSYHKCVKVNCDKTKKIIKISKGKVGSRGYCQNHENLDAEIEIIPESISKAPKKNIGYTILKILLGVLAVAAALAIVAAVFWFLYWSYIGLFASLHSTLWASFAHKELLGGIWVGLVIVGSIVGAILSGSTASFI